MTQIKYETETVSQTDGRTIHNIPRQHILSPECWCKPQSGKAVTAELGETTVYKHRLLAEAPL